MGANIAAFSHGQGSFNFGLRKRTTKAGMYPNFYFDLLLNQIYYSNQMSLVCVCVCFVD
jgi:hypothetical protein